MARMIGGMRRGAVWFFGLLFAMIFGRTAGAQEGGPREGPPPPPPPRWREPVKPPEKKPEGGLAESADWKVVKEAWNFGTLLAKSGESTTKQREESDKKFKAAEEAAKRLVAAGLISAAEAGLLAAEAEKIHGDIYRNPPTDFQGTCYATAYAPPAVICLSRLTERLSLLEKVVASGKVNKAVVEKVLGTIEADLAILSDEKQLAKLENDQKRTEAAKTRKAVEAQLEKVKALIKDEKPVDPKEAKKREEAEARGLAEKRWAKGGDKAGEIAVKLKNFEPVTSAALTKYFKEAGIYRVVVTNPMAALAGPPTKSHAIIMEQGKAIYIDDEKSAAQAISERKYALQGMDDTQGLIEVFAALCDYTLTIEPPAGSKTDPAEWKPAVQRSGEKWSVTCVFMTDPNIKACVQYTLDVDAQGAVTVKPGKFLSSAGGYK
jgi:hypothetical protein